MNNPYDPGTKIKVNNKSDKNNKKSTKKKKNTSKKGLIFNSVTDKQDTANGAGSVGSANISGNPNWTNPSTSEDEIDRLNIVFSVDFWTQYGLQRATYTLGRVDNDDLQVPVATGIKDELLGFTTNVDMNQNTPQFQVQLSGLRDWEDVLLPNDYLEISAKVYEDSPRSNDSTTGTAQSPASATLITGLISNIHKVADSQQGYSYVITCQGMQKILDNINLGLPSDLEANGGILLYDIGQASDPNVKGSSDSVDGSGGWNGSIPKGLKGNLKKIAPYAEKYGAKYKVLPSMIIAQSVQESSLGTAVPNEYNWWGLTGSIGHGTTNIGGYPYTKFESLDEAVKYYASCMGNASPGKSYWAVKRIRGISDAKKAIAVLGGDNSYHEASASSYTRGLTSAYNRYNLKRFDKNVHF